MPAKVQKQSSPESKFVFITVSIFAIILLLTVMSFNLPALDNAISHIRPHTSADSNSNVHPSVEDNKAKEEIFAPGTKSYIVVLNENVQNPKEKLAALMEDIKTKYHGEITNVYDSIFYGFAYRVKEADGFAASSLSFLQADSSVVVEEDQVVHAVNDNPH